MYNIGIDLGGTNIAVAIVDEKGRIVHKVSAPTQRERHYTAIVKDMAELALRAIEESNVEKELVHSV